MGLYDKIKQKKPPAGSDVILKYIAGSDGLGRIDGSSVYIKKTGLTVTVVKCKVVQMKKNGQFTAYVLFEVDRKDFDDPIVEPQTAWGSTRDKALEAAAEQLISMMLSMVLTIGLMAKDEDEGTDEGLLSVENCFDGSDHIYYYPETLPLIRAVEKQNGSSGEEAQIRLFDAVKDDIADYLGGRRYNWVKLFAGRAADKAECEVRVNGMLIPELSDKLKKFAEKQNGDKNGEFNFSLVKQCVLFVQSDRTYIEPRHTLAKIRDCAAKSIPILAGMKDDGSWDEGYKQICRITRDPVLANEIIHYLPEAAAQIMFSEMESVSPITLYCGDTEPLTFNKTQLTAWCGASAAIEEYYYEKKPTNQFMFELMDYLSSFYRAVCSILIEHPEVESLSGLTLCSLGCEFPEEYREKIY